MKLTLNFSTPLTRAYWWREVPNFGDALAPLLIEHFTGIKTTWDTVSHSAIVSVGSVLEHVPPLWDGYILGSGRLIEGSRTNIVQYKSGITAKILALRGPLSARGIPGDYALGDPGILANELVGPQEKLWDLGLVPHWQDAELVARFQNIIPVTSTFVVVNTADDPLTALKKIGACRRIVTSSLHGMITADAFGIPRRVETCAQMKNDGGSFKFRDYSASIKTPLKIGEMQEPSRFFVEDVQFAIYDAYQTLKEALRR